MVKHSRRIRILMLMGAALTILAGAPSLSQSAECKRKTAGFYLEDTNANGPRRLSQTLKALPVSLTGAIGDPERGRDVLINRQKGDCLSCHKVSTLSGIPDQGEVGPTLDGVGSKYSEAELRQITITPKSIFPDTIMPSYFAPVGSAEASVLSAVEVEDLVAYMKTLR